MAKHPVSHPIANWLGLIGGALLLAAPLAIGGMGSTPTALRWLALAGAALVVVAPMAASAAGMTPPSRPAPAEVPQEAEASRGPAEVEIHVTSRPTSVAHCTLMARRRR